ncbi:MAG: EF-P lysine aminoacylase GenX [Pirellulales bacterium]|nr:EF-P lysine aminoacylase GenX [Pirellulales bacterium]
MSDVFRPAGNWPNLRLRAEMLRRLRKFFDSRGFLEVETPILSTDTVVDRHLDPFCVHCSPLPQAEMAENNLSPLPQAGEGPGVRADCSGQWPAASGQRETASDDPFAPSPQPPAPKLWLQTSPEFHMKRLLAAGSGPIYQVARVFRQGELGPLHNPEFTMIEWYQPGDGMDKGMRLTVELCETLLSSVGRPHSRPLSRLRERGEEYAAERISYGDAFERYVGVDPHTAEATTLAKAAKALGVEAPESLSLDDRDGWLDLLMVERVQPNLGIDRPTLLFDYPAGQAALARIRRDEGRPPVAERFELFVAGVELANGYHELLDAGELRARNSRVNAQRVADGKGPLPEESRLLAAMEAGLPSAVGVALGFDRLAMLAAGAKTVAEVMAFSFDRA